MSTHCWIDVAVQTPAHTQVGGLLTYRSPFLVHPGVLVRVPFGPREVLGVVWAIRDQAPDAMPDGAGTLADAHRGADDCWWVALGA